MPRYQFARAARTPLLDQLIAAGFPPTITVETGEDRCWVTCEPEQFDAVVQVVSRHDAATIDAAMAQAIADQSMIRSLVTATAQTAAGVGLGALTPAQVRSLLAIVLYQAGGVTADGKVKPLAQWAR